MNRTIKAVAFDLGHTIISYGNPLNWQELYGDALANVLRAIDEEVDPNKIGNGGAVLLTYNTRVNSREYEIDSDTIFRKLFGEWGVSDLSKLNAAKEAFYSFFQNNAIVYDDTIDVLLTLRKRGYKTGILTDVAYGMDREYAIRDIAAISEYFDVVLTSTDVGFRKPNTKGYLRLSEELNTMTGNCVFVGDEEKDIIGANSAGMTSVLIDRNGLDRDYGQKHTIKSLSELLKLV